MSVDIVVFDLLGARDAYPGCPDRTLHALANYITRRIRPGAFLVACLENDLRAAVQAADADSYEALPHIIGVIDRFVPPLACGSKGAVMAWLYRRKTVRKERSHA